MIVSLRVSALEGFGAVTIPVRSLLERGISTCGRETRRAFVKLIGLSRIAPRYRDH